MCERENGVTVSGGLFNVRPRLYTRFIQTRRVCVLVVKTVTAIKRNSECICHFCLNLQFI